MGNASEVFSYLKKSGIPYRKDPFEVVATLIKWDLARIGDLCRSVSEMLPRRTSQTRSIFSFIGNASLAGFPSSCWNPSCRVESVDSIARFAALYADEVMLPDPFIYVYDAIDSLAKDKTRLCIDVATYISVLRLLEPVLSEGYIKFADTVHRNICADCYSRAIGEVKGDFSRKLTSLRKAIKEQFLSGATVTVEYASDGSIACRVRGPHSLIPHGEYVKVNRKIPSFLKNGATPGGARTLTRHQISSCRVLESEVNQVFDDILRQNWYSNLFGVNYITEREIDLKVVQSLRPRPRRRQSPAVSPTIFSHSLPVVNAIGLEKIIALRRTEGAAFELYRDALSKALRKHANATLSEQMELFSDVIRPEIAKIDLAVRRSRKLLVRSIAQDVVVAAGAIGIGLFSGLLPTAIGAAAVGLGSLHYSPQFVRKLAELCTEPKQAMDNRYYFLWRIQGMDKN